MMRTSSQFAILLILSLALCIGCGKKPSTPAPKSPAPTAPKKGTPEVKKTVSPKPTNKVVKPPVRKPPAPVVGTRKPPAPTPTTSKLGRELNDPVFDLLPAHTLALGIARSVTRLLQIADRDTLAKTFAKEYAAIGKMASRLGFHPFDPKGWEKNGVDLGRPAGVVLLRAYPNPIVGFFVGVRDAAAAKSLINRMKPKRVQQQTIASATLWSDRDLNILLRGNSLLIVAAESRRDSQKATALARKLAAMAPAKGLRQSATWKTAGLSSTADMWGVVSFPGIVREIDNAVEQRGKKMGKMDREMAVWFRKALASFKALGLSGRFSGSRFEMSYRLDMGKESFLSRIIGLGKPSIGARFLTQKPVMSFGFQLNLSGLWGIVKQFATTLDPSGNGLKKLDMILKQSVEKVVLPAIDGGLEFHLTGRGQTGPKSKANIDVYAFARLNNPAVIQGLMDMFGKQALKQVSVAGKNMYTFPSLPGKVGYLGIFDKLLVVTTEKALVEALVKKTPRASFLDSIKDPAIKSAYTRADSAVSVLDFRGLAWFVAMQMDAVRGKMMEMRHKQMLAMLTALKKNTPENVKKLKELYQGISRARGKLYLDESKQRTRLFDLVGSYTARFNLNRNMLSGGLAWHYKGATFGSWLVELLKQVKQIEQTTKINRAARTQAEKKLSNFIKSLK